MFVSCRLLTPKKLPGKGDIIDITLKDKIPDVHIPPRLKARGVIKSVKVLEADLVSRDSVYGRAVDLGPLRSILRSLHLMPKSGHEVQASQNVPQTT